MNTLTRIFLVLLRLAIGWHFLFEGLVKLESLQDGPREGRPQWSAAGFLSESQGPFRSWFREQAGTLNEDAIARLTLPREPGKLPQSIEEDWTKRFDRFVQHHELGKHAAVQPENVGLVAMSPLATFPSTVPWAMLFRSAPDSSNTQAQLVLARQDVDLARSTALQWFAHGTRETPSKLPGVTEKVKETTAQRIDSYKENLKQIADIEEHGMPAFDRDVWKEKYRALKQETVQMRTELLRELDRPFEDALSAAKFRLTKEQRDKGSVAEVPSVVTKLDRMNVVTAWGLTIVGGCLLLGLFTRLACVTAAVFLLLVYLAMPALPWLPLNPRSEGHYLFIDKNIIEMLALLVLVSTRSGKWLGLDAILQYLNPFRRRRA